MFMVLFRPFKLCIMIFYPLAGVIALLDEPESDLKVSFFFSFSINIFLC